MYDSFSIDQTQPSTPIDADGYVYINHKYSKPSSAITNFIDNRLLSVAIMFEHNYRSHLLSPSGKPMKSTKKTMIRFLNHHLFKKKFNYACIVLELDAKDGKFGRYYCIVDETGLFIVDNLSFCNYGILRDYINIPLKSCRTEFVNYCIKNLVDLDNLSYVRNFSNTMLFGNCPSQDANSGVKTYEELFEFVNKEK